MTDDTHAWGAYEVGRLTKELQQWRSKALMRANRIKELEGIVDMMALDNGRLLGTIVELRQNRNDPGEREA